ncbi:MAG TPA: glycosyltransferase family 4 protein [Chloroflexota bacterium]|jgi:glycosyltransferase involved in cell wall biosynthesis|nr:glycosyltransferase family 4 protein [Chloroflexota bacterium]
MRIALAYPTYWPYVRRGVERYMHDLAAYLAGQGHAVDILTTKPGAGRVAQAHGVRTVYFPERTHPVLARYRPLLRFYTFGLSCLPRLLREKYDVAHLWMYPYGPSVHLARQLRGTAYIYHTIVDPPHWPGALDRWIFRRTLYSADRVAVLTRGAAAQVQREFGLPAAILPPPVDTAVFRPLAPKDPHRPRVLFTSDLGDTRKGGVLLLRAWNLVHRRRPEAVLTLAGPFRLAGEMFVADLLPMIQQLVPGEEARRQIEIRGPGSLEALPGLYSSAAVTVLPSINEPFGMVLTESLACGTPVVCSHAGGPGEIVDDPAIGTTVDLTTYEDIYGTARVEALAEAILRTIDLGAEAATAERCRARASAWSLDAVGRRALALYEEVVARRQPRATAAGAPAGTGGEVAA